MAIFVEQTIASLRKSAEGYVLIGHSMGGKVASMMARRAEDGLALSGVPKALILISPSPPAPEPMQESKRAEVTRKLGSENDDQSARAAYAHQFVNDNVGKLELDPEIEVCEAVRMLTSSPSAFDLWMSHSSKEDLRDTIGRIRMPALVLAGTEDAALGPAAQQELMLPHLAGGSMEVLQGAGHLAPLERPSEIAFRIVHFLGSLNLAPRYTSRPRDGFLAQLNSDSTSPQTRRVMETRLTDRAPLGGFSVERAVTIDALIRCVVPSAGPNLLGRLEHSFLSEKGDGWRFDTLAADLRSWEQGLQTLDHAALHRHGVNFAALPGRLQAEFLDELQAGKIGKGMLGKLQVGEEADDLSSVQMKAWFEDVRGELSKLYASDPQTMDRIGFTGFADEKGFDLVKLKVSEDRS